MLGSGLHYYDPRKEKENQVMFVSTVAENMLMFTKRHQVKGAEVAKALYTSLICPSMKDFKWII